MRWTLPDQAAEGGLMDEMGGQDVQDRSLTMAQMLRVAMDVLARRVQQWAVLLLAFTLFGWVALHPDWIRLAAANAFSMVALWLFKKERA